MPYGYLGEQPKQSKANSGVFNTVDALDLQTDGEWGGSLEHIETLSPDGVNNITCSVLPTNYDILKVCWTVESTTGTANVYRMTFFESGVEETGNVYHYAQRRGTPGGTFGTDCTTSSDDLYLGNFDSSKSTGYAYFYNLSDNTRYSSMTYHAVAGSGAFYYGSGGLLQKSLVDQIKFRNASAVQTFVSGSEIKIYGIKQI